MVFGGLRPVSWIDYRKGDGMKIFKVFTIVIMLPGADPVAHASFSSYQLALKYQLETHFPSDAIVQILSSFLEG